LRNSRKQRAFGAALLLLAGIFLEFPLTVAAAGRCTDDLPSASRLADETIRKISTMPDKEISLSGAVFLISARAALDFDCRKAEDTLVEKELDRIAKRILASIGNGGAADPGKTVAAMNRVVFDEEKFVYDPAPGDPYNYLLDRVLANKRGNCLGLTVVFLSLAERLGVPLSGVYAPSHCFARYEGNGFRINIETGAAGGERKDDWYARKFRIGEGRPYLRTLGKKEMIGVFLKSLGAAYSRQGREEEALRLYREAAAFYPGLPDVYYNAGVSFQKLGRHEEAIGQYRIAITVDPGMAAARGNMAASLCGCGKIEDGIREYRKALEISPENATARAGLAKAYFSQGAYLEAIEHCDRAIEQGCRFEPSMLEVLNRYRRPGDSSSRP
jgi:tetratricopeptide (TPR) repeat protein